MEKFYSELLKQIRKIRKEKGFTQENVAKEIEVERSTYVRKEAGSIPITTKEFMKIAQFLEFSYEFNQGVLKINYSVLKKTVDEVIKDLNSLADKLEKLKNEIKPQREINEI